MKRQGEPFERRGDQNGRGTEPSEEGCTGLYHRTALRGRSRVSVGSIAQRGWTVPQEPGGQGHPPAIPGCSLSLRSVFSGLRC